MANTVPFKRGEESQKPSDSAPEPRPAPEKPQEYSSEEVSEIIRVALRNAADEGLRTVNHDEMLAIAKDFGLNGDDLDRALKDISLSRDAEDLSLKVKQAFRLHMALYAVIISGLLLINWATMPSFWWSVIPAVGWGMAVAIHGILAKYAPDVPVYLFKQAAGLMDAQRSLRTQSERATFSIEEVFGGMAETHGLARLEKDILILEFETRDSVIGMIRSGLKEVKVPVKDISAVRFEKKMFKTQLTVQGARMRSFKNVPGNKAGEIRLLFDKNARESSTRLATALADRLAVHRGEDV